MQFFQVKVLTQEWAGKWNESGTILKVSISGNS
jgi:hypothetical protein